ncbi:transposon Tf2-9 polyprotein [Elysia marginata]|uniref:Transposon Tf2-9 polyprotein n=1 Tax=Elysia marginata TaxID=1093978 RepID=A0AAV4K1D8_9GAST|nr:transposon Tf2-9 polyprotein [Elysia marginata]
MLLVHYDLNKPIILTCDASLYGKSAVLSHRYGNTEKPIMIASKSLSDAEKNYSQLDKEALSIIFGVTKFHKYIYGRQVTIYTDHKPLLGLFGEHKQLPE